MSENVQCVVHHPSGWAVVAKGGHRPKSVHETQAQAIDAARMAVISCGGGEVRIKRLDGKWPHTEIIGPGKDPFSPRGTR